jgi:hypothetical protein
MADAIESQPICDCGPDTRWCDGQSEINYTYNHDIESLSDKINRFIVELGLSETANIHGTNEFDMARFNSYLEGLRILQAWINATPQLDLPNTYPRKFCLTNIVDMPAIESDGVRTLIRLLELMRDELVRGQSTRQASGLGTYDNERLTMTIAKCQALLDNVESVDGLDYPNSAPTTNVTGGGAIGPRMAR